MEAFWKEDITVYPWGNFANTICSNCEQPPLESGGQDALSPYCPWCGCKMTNAEEE